MERKCNFVKVDDRWIELGKYRHFKGKDYYVVDVVKDTTNSGEGKYKVLYRALYDAENDDVSFGDFFCRDIDEFFSGVDFNKYPDATQDERFRKL